MSLPATSGRPLPVTNPTVQAYAELQAAFDHYNERLFGGELPFCLITMQREARTYGYFSSERFVHRHDKRKTDEIAINPAFFAVVPLLEVLQTLVHEMVHAWQFHFGKPGRRGYHNKEWADKMESIGLMPSSTGKPGGARTGEKMADYPIPGGLFMQATDELLAREFTVSWIDRFPVRIAGSMSSADAGDDDGGELAELVAELAKQPTGNRSNRVKYRCPTCGAQAWGKPSLRLLCGGDDCDAAELEAVG